MVINNEIIIINFNKRHYFINGEIGCMIFVNSNIDLYFYDSSKNYKYLILFEKTFTIDEFNIFCNNLNFFECENSYYQKLFVKLQSTIKKYYNYLNNESRLFRQN